MKNSIFILVISFLGPLMADNGSSKLLTRVTAQSIKRLSLQLPTPNNAHALDLAGQTQKEQELTRRLCRSCADLDALTPEQRARIVFEAYSGVNKNHLVPYSVPGLISSDAKGNTARPSSAVSPKRQGPSSVGPDIKSVQDVISNCCCCWLYKTIVGAVGCCFNVEFEKL